MATEVSARSWARSEGGREEGEGGRRKRISSLQLCTSHTAAAADPLAQTAADERQEPLRVLLGHRRDRGSSDLCLLLLLPSIDLGREKFRLGGWTPEPVETKIGKRARARRRKHAGRGEEDQKEEEEDGGMKGMGRTGQPVTTERSCSQSSAVNMSMNVGEGRDVDLGKQ
eukprot:765811-Hanusia_phi.AAC.2